MSNYAIMAIQYMLNVEKLYTYQNHLYSIFMAMKCVEIVKFWV